MELAYLPPNGTKYKWSPPALRGRPWTYHYRFPDLRRSLNLSVDLLETGLYQGSALLWDLDGNMHVKWTRKLRDPLKVLLAAEKIGDRMLAKQRLPAWAEEALALGWRPPIRGYLVAGDRIGTLESCR